LILAPLSLQLPPLSLLLSDESVPLASLLSLVLLNEEAPPSLIASNIREDNNKFTANFEPPSPLAYLESLAMESVANNSFDWNKNNNVTANFDQPSAKSLSAQSSILPSAAAAAAAESVSKGWSNRLDRQTSIQSLEMEPLPLASLLSPESSLAPANVVRDNHDLTHAWDTVPTMNSVQRHRSAWHLWIIISSSC